MDVFLQLLHMIEKIIMQTKIVRNLHEINHIVMYSTALLSTTAANRD